MRKHFYILIFLLFALAGAAGAGEQLNLQSISTGNCKGDGMTVMLWAVEGRSYRPEQLDGCRISSKCREGSLEERRACTVANRWRHPSNNWVPPMMMADVMSGYAPASMIMPFLTDSRAWGLNGVETGSIVYLPINIASVMAFHDWARRTGEDRLQGAASRWLEAQWAYLALQATRRAPETIRYKVSDGPWQIMPRRNEWSYNGPFTHVVGDRSEAGPAYASISQLHYLLAWAIDERRSGRIPVAEPFDDVHYPVHMVAKLAGVSSYRADVKPEIFGLTRETRRALRKLLRNPTRVEFLPPVVQLLEGYPILGSRVDITRFETGETLAVYLESRNTATFPGINAVWSEGSTSSWVSGARHTRPGAPFGSHRGYCKPRGAGKLECGSAGDGVSFSVDVPSGPVAWKVTIDDSGARILGADPDLRAETPRDAAANPALDLLLAELAALRRQVRAVEAAAKRLGG